MDIQALRTTYATLMADPSRGLSLKELAEACRHRDVRTTMKHYVKARESRVRGAVNSLDLGKAAGERG